jgi:hypothetical protein
VLLQNALYFHHAQTKQPFAHSTNINSPNHNGLAPHMRQNMQMRLLICAV